ncbi:histidine phosphatase family protein [Microbacterium sp. NEAU-LLC]|uniref:Histidine phosphatase family protein n=1 Tax=Microbacterium helvum TaxID=2773713 RepID=A0ABR8NHQ5_9MICO|nr:histidine phosphatase family protein [Microbacterium helvum]MBD3940215.1 histidine phosphatase family protein [Microbacterium helvum]
MTGRVLVARHGETMLNVLARVQGWCDSPLTERGRAEAAALGVSVGAAGSVGAVFCADSGRHRETAALAMPGVPARADARWRELAFGAYEGALSARLWNDLRRAYGPADGGGVLEALVALPDLADHGALPVESAATLRARAREAFEIAAAEAPVHDVLVVTSGLTMLALLAELDVDASRFDGGVHNGAHVVITRRSGGWRVE